jgi:hypothetical protein
LAETNACGGLGQLESELASSAGEGALAADQEAVLTSADVRVMAEVTPAESIVLRS